jgi:hypothetical protein
MELLKEKAVGLTTTNGETRSLSYKKQSKLGTILSEFLKGRSLNRFEAELLNDHCLNTTVSTIGKLGILIDRKSETIPCVKGRFSTTCKRYWLNTDPENIARTRKYFDGEYVLPISTEVLPND